MAKSSIDHSALTKLQKKIANLGEDYIVKATINALTKSKEYANQQVIEAMNNSPYAFKRGQKSNKGVGGGKVTKGKNKPATGNALKSAEMVANMPVEVVGGFVYAYVGVSWYDAPEVTLLAFGTPHIASDFNLHNAVKVKGKYEQEVLRIQQEEFNKVLKEAMSKDD